MKDKSNALLTSNAFMRYEHPTYRKLTPLECERLQTLPEGYTNTVSNSQAYKMIGNGWTIEVIKHIFKNLIELPKKKETIRESWECQTIMINSCVVSYDIEDEHTLFNDGYVWIYFAYSANAKDFKLMVEHLRTKFSGMIVEFKITKLSLFKNHCTHQVDEIYRWNN